MSKKNKKNQAPNQEGDAVQVEKIVKVELSDEQKVEKIHELRLNLQAAKEEKDIPVQKKIRRQLRKLGYFISKEKEKALEAASA